MNTNLTGESMSEVTDLTVIEIKPEQAPALYVANGLDDYLAHIREMAAEAPDVTTKKGRDRIGSLALMVSKSKTAIENPGRAYLKKLKESVKPAEVELKRFVDECDAIRDAILKPRIEWMIEQDRIAAENQMLTWHEEALEMNSAFDAAARLKFETDHEMALLMNDAFDREAAEAKAEAERQRIAHEEELKRQAAEQAKREAEEKTAAELAASQKREADAIAAKAQAELLAKQAAEKSESDRLAAIAKADADKQEAIAEEKRKAQAEADRIKREADEKEQARLADEKRIADEAAARAANEKHRKVIGTDIVSALLGHTSLTREQAIEVLVALKDNKIPHTSITY
jgi:hypothetical protein